MQFFQKNECKNFLLVVSFGLLCLFLSSGINPTNKRGIVNFDIFALESNLPMKNYQLMKKTECLYKVSYDDFNLCISMCVCCVCVCVYW